MMKQAQRESDSETIYGSCPARSSAQSRCAVFVLDGIGLSARFTFLMALHPEHAPRTGVDLSLTFLERRWHAKSGGFTTSMSRVSEHIFRALLFWAEEELKFDFLGIGPIKLIEDEVQRFQARAVKYRRLPWIPNVVVLRWIRARLFDPFVRDRLYRWLCSRHGYSLMFYTGGWPWGTAPLARHELVTAYDLFPERMDLQQLEKTRRRLAERREGLWVSAISSFTAGDVVEMLGLHPERVVSIPLGVDHQIYRPDTAMEDDQNDFRRRFPDGFVLFVGSFAMRKNFLVLAKAVEALNQRRSKPLALVMAGPKNGAPLRTRMKVRSELQAIFRKTPFTEITQPSDLQMAALYRCATVLGHPSLFEGFGFTVIEAMACGCPVVCGRHSSLIEVGGDAAEFVADVQNVEEFATALEKIADSESLRKERGAAGVKHAATFTWERFEKETAALHRRILAT